LLGRPELAIEEGTVAMVYLVGKLSYGASDLPESLSSITVLIKHVGMACGDRAD